MEEDFDDLDLSLPVVQDAKTKDPALLGWPPSLPLELALGEHTPEEFREGYGFTEERWAALMADPTFKAAVDKYVELMKTEGMTFKLKAQLQSEALLNQSWKLIHDPATPANVRADLIKYTWKCAGHEPKTGGGDGGQANTFQININL